MERLTLAELGRYTGKDGMPAYIAFQGVIYDVSESYQWRQGKHQVVHRAGHDLTQEMEQAPHGADLLLLFPAVGLLDPS